MALHTLVLLRHAKSDWSRSGADIDRPLAARGERQAREAGDWLAASTIAIDRIVVSPAARAVQTVEHATAGWTARPPVTVDARVYEAESYELLTVIHELAEAATTVLLTGHNPGFEDIATALSGDDQRMRTAEIVVLEFDTSWAAVTPGTARIAAAGRPPA